ncbi:MAG: UDP-N-acetylglucosamine diphosphorylase / glucose-phosphate thymidylyltransferase [Patescibacteria group bacterium]|jgi:NDP-sugar pyrophosphorylase family protein|nr:UDP-N-acetylglucosamine diphosphorylase / glucose-phosphate thymidylyltransferase [Patescibacteria group bacterium]
METVTHISMQVIILAAGKGIRMGDLTADIPKPMLPLLGKPLLEWRLAMLPEAVREVIFVVGYLGDQIEKYFGSEWQGRSIRYVRHEKLDGTGGAIRQVYESGLFLGPALVTNGDDIYCQEDLERLLTYDMAVLACGLEDSSRFGILDTDAEGRLRGIIERPHAPGYGLVNTGAYMLDQAYFSYAPVPISETEYGLPQTLVLVGDERPVSVVQTRAWQPVGQPEDIALGEDFLRQYWLARQ